MHVHGYEICDYSSHKLARALLCRRGLLIGTFFALACEKKEYRSSLSDSSGVTLTILWHFSARLNSQDFLRISLTVLLPMPNWMLKLACFGLRTASLAAINSTSFSSDNSLCPLFNAVAILFLTRENAGLFNCDSHGWEGKWRKITDCREFQIYCMGILSVP